MNTQTHSNKPMLYTFRQFSGSAIAVKQLPVDVGIHKNATFSVKYFYRAICVNKNP
jgi:hypothetical protein